MVVLLAFPTSFLPRFCFLVPFGEDIPTSIGWLTANYIVLRDWRTKKEAIEGDDGWTSSFVFFSAEKPVLTSFQFLQFAFQLPFLNWHFLNLTSFLSFAPMDDSTTKKIERIYCSSRGNNKHKKLVSVIQFVRKTWVSTHFDRLCSSNLYIPVFSQSLKSNLLLLSSRNKQITSVQKV